MRPSLPRVLAALLGLALIWIPAIVFVIAAFLVAGYARHYWARLKLWAGRR